MSYLLLASVLSGIYIVVFAFMWPEALTFTQYWMGFVMCFLMDRIMDSKVKERGGRGICLWRNNETVTVVG